MIKAIAFEPRDPEMAGYGDQPILRIDLANPWETGFVVNSIEGLGPPKADISIARMATLPGGKWNASRVAPRDITIKFTLLEVPTIQAVRRLSYLYFPVGDSTYMYIETDDKTFRTRCWIEESAPDIFSSQETLVVNLRCEDAYLEKVDGIGSWEWQHRSFYEVTPEFEFPFSDEGTADVEFSQLENLPGRVIDYDGDVPTGFNFEIELIGPGADFRLYDINQDYGGIKILNSLVAKITGTSGLMKGDIILISTRAGFKFARLFRPNVAMWNIIGAIDSWPQWLALKPGSNFYAIETTAPNSFRVSIDYITKYQGI